MLPKQRDGIINVHGIALDLNGWPIVRVTPPPYSLSDDVLAEFMDLHRQIVRSMESPYVVLLDLRHCEQMSRSQRLKLTDIMGRAQDNPLPACLGTALVFRSKIMRRMLGAMFWLFRPPYPVKVFPNAETARSWLQTLIAGAERKVA